MTNRKKKVLFVEDDAIDLMALEQMLSKNTMDHEFTFATSLKQAISKLNKKPFDLIVTDFHLGDGDALDIVTAAPDTATIITTETGDQITAVKSIKAGVYDYLVKDTARHYLEILPHTMESVMTQHADRMRIKRLEGIYKALSDACPLGIFSTDQHGYCLYTNARYQSISGLSAEECLGDGWGTSIHPEDWQQVQEEWYQAAKKNEGYSSVHRFLRSDGSIVWCNVKAAAITEDGKCTGYVGTVEDITKDKLAEDLLRKNEEQLELSLKGADLGLWDWDIKNDQVTFNERWAEMVGYTLEEIDPNEDFWIKLIHPDDADFVMQTLKDHLAGKTPIYETEHRLRAKNGSWVWVLDRGRVLERDTNGSPLRALGTHLDITIRKVRDTELLEAKTAAESANLARGQFLSHMSHEIRTPLTAIIGFAEVAQEETLPPPERTMMLGTILRNANHLLAIINDILDISKIDAGSMTLEEIKASPIQMVEEVKSLLHLRAKENGINMKVRYEWPLPRFVHTDPLRIKQLLLNLVGNAIKFTKKGAVIISLSCDRENELLQFSIIDTGIGLTEQQLSRLFKPFSQADATTTRQFGGTGLGLAICKQLVNVLGGEITVQSTPGVGSTFSFSVASGVLDDIEFVSCAPAETFTTIPDELKTPSGLKGRILLADDSEDNQLLLAHTLRMTELELTIVDNGKAALDTALTETFDLILMDMHMPVMDGYTATEKLREAGVKTPIIAFTANSMQHDVLKCLEVGCTAHLSKPFSKAQFLGILAQQLHTSIDARVSSKPVLRKFFEEDPNSLVIIVKFITGLQTRLDELRKALQLVDYVRLENEAHRLNGSAGLYGYSELSRLACLLELSAREQRLEQCQNLYNSLMKAHQDILESSALMKNFPLVANTIHNSSS
jgi:PAS domain S-box-containing protein